MFIISKCTIKKNIHITNYKQHILFFIIFFNKKTFSQKRQSIFPYHSLVFPVFQPFFWLFESFSKSRYRTVYVTPRENVQSQKLKFGFYSKFIGSKQLKCISNSLLTIDIMQFEANPIENTKLNLTKCLCKFLCLESRLFKH